MTIRIWQSYSCNNSSSYRLVARFSEPRIAAETERELRAVLESTVVMTDKETLDADDLRLPNAVGEQPPTLNLDELETWAIRQALKQTNRNITQAAKLLGIVRDTLATKIKRKGIDREDVQGAADQ